ncbi:LysR family transcriptional regulator [Pseudonocardia sp. MH-G8]|uniref:LysR family transcriptional regulator n=1 Tax=Pseudonocardia sp. MH-G8 TaxID=1854588 RepID=UPI000BA13E82|nr:LysR family transcriptional regulator [Pseudonocardia sp. MH-G8]OZM78772.1 LysR family transcriptional regulator [Pseudonocardia sp. MH-G8]
MLRADLRLEWLVSFLAVVETGSFVAAAEVTHRSQPRISMHVAALERGVGLPLFNRRKRPVELTEAGKALSEHARTILREVEATEAAMAAWRDGARGVVTLGSHPSASAAFVPHVLREAARVSPDVRVVLVERSTLELDDALTSGEIDLCIRPMTPAPARASVRQHVLWREPLVALHPPDHPLADLPEPLPVAEVAAHPLLSIGRLDAPETGEFESYRLFRECGFELEPVQATNQPQTLVSLVRHGFGVGVTNSLAAEVTDTSDLCVRRLEGAAGRRVAVYWDSTRLLTAAARTLLQQIVAQPRPDGTEPPERPDPPRE